MQAPIRHINNCIPVLNGAAEILCTHRELRGNHLTNEATHKKRKKHSEKYYASRTKEGYQTNRSIKTWACYFLLKSKTTTGHIQRWTLQKESLLAYLQISENGLRTRLAECKALGLLTITKNHTIQLTSYKTAAEILNLPYTGLTKIEYDANTMQGNQLFQYLLRGQEIHNNQQAQLEAINYYTNKNPQLKAVLADVLIKHGATHKQLNDKEYFQQRLFALQQHYFKAGTDIWNILTTIRADVNRSVNGIQKAHKYKSPQSVSYLKRRMAALQLLDIAKKTIQSNVRTRLYVPNEEGKNREAARYHRSSKTTFMHLCDQLQVKITTHDTNQKAAAKQQAA